MKDSESGQTNPADHRDSLNLRARADVGLSASPWVPPQPVRDRVLTP
jgi:hypothetical protein